MIKIKQYITADLDSPFEEWFEDLDNVTAAKITNFIYRLEIGNFSNVEGVGEGVYEQKINFSSGYRVYFGKDGAELVILLCGGTKKRQSKDIQTAKKYWNDYKKRKREV